MYSNDEVINKYLATHWCWMQAMVYCVYYR